MFFMMSEKGGKDDKKKDKGDKDKDKDKDKHSELCYN